MTLNSVPPHLDIQVELFDLLCQFVLSDKAEYLILEFEFSPVNEISFSLMAANRWSYPGSRNIYTPRQYVNVTY